MTSRVRRFTILVAILLLSPQASVADELVGFTEPFRTVEISVAEPGVIESIDVRPGDKVASGQRLLALNTSVLEATLAMARQKANSTGSVDAAKAELALRNDRALQVSRLRQRGHATQQEMDRAQTDVDIAQAKMQLAIEEHALNVLDCKRIETQIARRQVYSPYEGIVSEIHREMGESAVVTDPRIITLVQLDRLRARFPAKPGHATNLRVGQETELSVQGSAKPVVALVERISPVIDAKSGTLEVQVVMDNAQQTIRSGARCRMQVVDAEQTSASLAVGGNR